MTQTTAEERRPYWSLERYPLQEWEDWDPVPIMEDLYEHHQPRGGRCSCGGSWPCSMAILVDSLLDYGEQIKQRDKMLLDRDRDLEAAEARVRELQGAATQAEEMQENAEHHESEARLERDAARTDLADTEKKLAKAEATVADLKEVYEAEHELRQKAEARVKELGIIKCSRCGNDLLISQAQPADGTPDAMPVCRSCLLEMYPNAAKRAYAVRVLEEEREKTWRVANAAKGVGGNNLAGYEAAMQIANALGGLAARIKAGEL